MADEKKTPEEEKAENKMNKENDHAKEHSAQHAL